MWPFNEDILRFDFETDVKDGDQHDNLPTATSSLTLPSATVESNVAARLSKE
jgi:hypothetical protein